MGITKTVLKRPVSALMIILAVIVFGISSIFGFRMEQLPDVEMPILLVMTVYPGADPESVDRLVSTEIEGAAQSLSGVQTVQSRSAENYSMVMIRYEYGTDIDSSYLDLRAALDSAAASFPSAAQEPMIIEMDVDSVASITITATAENSGEVLTFLDEGMEAELESLSTVAEVEVSGGEENYIRVLLKEDMLNQYGLTMSSVASYIAATDFTIPIGSLNQGSQSVSTVSTAANETVQEIQKIPLQTSTRNLVRLSDVAEVSWSVKDAESISRLNGEETVTISVTKNQSAGTVDISEDVHEIVEKYQGQTDEIEFEIFHDGADSVKSSLGSVASTLVLGVILSMLVLFLFFGDVRASLIVGSSIPLSLLVTLILMNQMGFSLNVVTLGALVIAIGMMVDNSIIVLESCFRLKEKKADFKEAAFEGTRVVLSSIVASTITTIVVYVPLAALDGLAGQLFSQLGYTIVFAMLTSLFSAMAFIPLFFTLFKPEEKKEVWINRPLGKVNIWYDRNIRKIMYRKKSAVLAAVILLALAFGMLSQVDLELMPSTDSGSLSITAEFRSGTQLSEIDERIAELEELISGYEDVKNYNLTASGYTARLTVNLKDDRRMSTAEIKEDILQRTRDLTGMEVEIGGSGVASILSSSGGELVLEGYDLEELKEAAADLADRARDVPGVLSVSSTADTDSTKIEIRIDPLKAMSYGLTPAQAAAGLHAMVSGTEAMTITSDGKEYSVFLEYPEGTYDNANSLMNAMLTSPAGLSIPVSEIAAMEYTDGQDMIIKENGKYKASISASCLDSDQAEVQKKLDILAGETNFPESVNLTSNSATATRNEEFSAIFQAILIAVFLIFLVMAIQFESPKYSLMVMLSIPFSLIGSFFLLFVTGSTLSMVSLMGVLMLVGIVVNNGILYVDTVNMLRETLSIEEALVESGKMRLRPILMTTLTTILSMVPMAFGIGEGSVIMQGMALIIIGGLLTSTVLILILLPSFYLIFYGKKRNG